MTFLTLILSALGAASIADALEEESLLELMNEREQILLQMKKDAAEDWILRLAIHAAEAPNLDEMARRYNRLFLWFNAANLISKRSKSWEFEGWSQNADSLGLTEHLQDENRVFWGEWGYAQTKGAAHTYLSILFRNEGIIKPPRSHILAQEFPQTGEWLRDMLPERALILRSIKTTIGEGYNRATLYQYKVEILTGRWNP